MEICEILANFTADNINASRASSADESQMSEWAKQVKQEKTDEDETQEYQYNQQHHHHHEIISEVKLETEELTAAAQHPYFQGFAAGAASTGPITTFDSDCASTPASSASFDSDFAPGVGTSTSFASQQQQHHHHQQQQQHRTDHQSQSAPNTPPFKYDPISASVSRILNGKFFKITREDTSDNITAVCLKCLPQVVEIKGNKKTTSNFVSHLKRRHGQETLDEYERWKRQRREDGGTSSRPSHALQTYYNRKHPELAGSSTTYPQQQQQQVQHQQQQQQQNFNETMVKYVIHSLIPLREVNNPYFKKLFEPLLPSLVVPTRRQLVDEIDKRFDRHVAIVTGYLQAAKYICTTTDLIWLPSQRCSILGVTAHWMHADNLQRQSAALACRRFEQRTKAPLTANVLQEILQKYGINQSKLVASIITDNGRNYVRGFKTFGVETGIMKSATADVHEMEAIKKEAEECDNDDTEDDHEDNSDEDDEDDDDDSDSVGETPPTSDAAWQSALPNSLSASNHALIVCATVAFQEALRNHTALAQLHAQVIAKCNILWKFTTKSKSARRKLTAILGGGGGGGSRTLALPVATRWNSLADALKQLVQQRDKMSAAAQALQIVNPLTAEDFSYLIEYLRCTEPITRALDVLQDDEEDNIYYGIVLPCILSLKHKLEALRSLSWVHCAPLIATLCDNVSARFHELIGFKSTQSQKAVIASITLPRFKNRWFRLVAPTLHAHLLEILKNEAAAEQNNATTRDAQTEEPTSVSYKNDDFFDFLTERSDPMGVNGLVNTCELEVLKYLSDPDTRLTCLDNYPIVRKLFMKFNTPLPSSAPAERLLPYESMINMPPRSHRSSRDDMFEKRIILKSKISKLQ